MLQIKSSFLKQTLIRCPIPNKLFNSKHSEAPVYSKLFYSRTYLADSRISSFSWMMTEKYMIRAEETYNLISDDMVQAL